MLVTIIIPIYNMELYLKNCLDSIFAQSYKNLQIILVDDGSKDSSSELCDAYQQEDPRIEVIHKSNGGLGFARNSGMEKAKGEYIFFLDADDWISAHCIEKLMKVVQTYSYDIVKGLHYLVKKNEIKLTSYSYSSGVVKRNGTKEETDRYHRIKTKSTFGSACGTFYRREFLEKYQMLFDENQIIFLEDMLFNLKMFSHNPEFYVLCEPLYYYLIREGSIMNSRRKNVSTQLLNLIRVYSKYLTERGTYAENVDLLVLQIARYFCWSVSDVTAEATRKFSETNEIVVEFGKDDTVASVLSIKHVFKHLINLENKADVIFYLACMFLLKRKCYRILTILFVSIDPMMKLYKGKKSRA